MKVEKIYPRDIIALITLVICFILIAYGINSFVTGIIILIVTFYFARRFDGDGEPSRDINEKVKKLEKEVKEIPKIPQVPIKKQENLSKDPRVVIKPPIPG